MIFNPKRCFWEKCFLSLSSLICLSLCLYNIYEICEMYFGYKTTTFVKYESISKISLPAITLCFAKQDVYKKKDPAHPKATNDLLKSLAELSIKEQLEQLYDFDDIGNCSIMTTLGLDRMETKPPNSFVNCSKISPIRRSVDYERYFSVCSS